MSFYSFVVRSQNEVILPSRSIAIGEGIDTFNKVVEDLPEFLSELAELEVRVLEYHQLDRLDSIQPTLGQIPGVSEEVGLLSIGEHPQETEE